MRFVFLFLFSILTIGLFAQSTEEEAVIQIIETLFDGMRETDSVRIQKIVTADATLQSIFQTKKGERKRNTEVMKHFITSVGTPHDHIYNEKIWSYDIKIDGLMASAWTEYSFFLDEKLLHCGVNNFQLFKSEEGWKIISITDTRRRNGCETWPENNETAENDIHSLMDQWHLAAATANDSVFFGSMTEDGIYLGTDISERWLSGELKEWSKAFFVKESAWSFTPSNRTIYFDKSREMAWFEEDLATWMGPCKGSGVLEKTTLGWRIKHYHLAVAVANEDMDQYLEILKEKKD